VGTRRSRPEQTEDYLASVTTSGINIVKKLDVTPGLQLRKFVSPGWRRAATAGSRDEWWGACPGYFNTSTRAPGKATRDGGSGSGRRMPRGLRSLDVPRRPYPPVAFVLSVAALPVGPRHA
jgi:hypothetical protein